MHVDTHFLLALNQSAHRRGHSAETALLKVYSDLIGALDSSSDNQSVLAVLDMTAAFDTRQVFVYLTGMSECRPVHRTMLHNKNSNVRIKQYSNGISLECDEL